MKSHFLITKIILLTSMFVCITYAQTSRCEREPNGHVLPVPTRTSFIRCNNGRENLQHCPNGQEFEPFERRCTVAPTSSVTRVRPAVQDACQGLSDGTLLADPSSSNSYINCVNGAGYILTCQSNKIFVVERAACEQLRVTTRAVPTRPPPTPSANNRPAGPVRPTAAPYVPPPRPRPAPQRTF